MNVMEIAWTVITHFFFLSENTLVRKRIRV